MHSSTPGQETGALVCHSSWEIHRRVMGALLIRELLTRYGRNNIGFLWLFIEPAAFIVAVTVIWTAVRNVHVSNLPIMEFALTGYASLLVWRNAANRCIGAMRANKALLFHRQVTITDIFSARVVLEIVAVSTAFIGLAIALYALGLLELPENTLQVIGGWFLLCWFAAGLGFTIGGLSEKAEVIGRFWNSFSYFLMAVSGVAYIADALPPGVRSAALLVPMLNGVEFLREGWFGSSMRAHYDLAYLIAFNTGLTLVGLILVRQVGFDSSDE